MPTTYGPGSASGNAPCSGVEVGAGVIRRGVATGAATGVAPCAGSRPYRRMSPGRMRSPPAGAQAPPRRLAGWRACRPGCDPMSRCLAPRTLLPWAAGRHAIGSTGQRGDARCRGQGPEVVLLLATRARRRASLALAAHGPGALRRPVASRRTSASSPARTTTRWVVATRIAPIVTAVWTSTQSRFVSASRRTCWPARRTSGASHGTTPLTMASGTTTTIVTTARARTYTTALGRRAGRVLAFRRPMVTSRA